MFQRGADVLRSCGCRAVYGNIPTDRTDVAEDVQRMQGTRRTARPFVDVLRMVCGWCVVHVVEMQTERARAKRGLSADGTDGTEKGRDAEMIPKSQQRAVAKYNKEHYRQIIVKMNKESDSDLLAFLDSLPNGEKAGFIKRAIRNYIETLSL